MNKTSLNFDACTVILQARLREMKQRDVVERVSSCEVSLETGLGGATR